MIPPVERRVFVSWSGGKDGCLALCRTIEAGFIPAALLTMMIESGERSRSHGLHRSVLDAQADAMRLPLYTVQTTWADYEASFIAAAARLAAAGLRTGVFGDIDIEHHRQWEQRICAAAGAQALLPLWQQPRRVLLEECFARGIEARIVAARDGVLDRRFLGRLLTPDLVSELEGAGVDACGENGEFHTVVTHAPGLFHHPLRLTPGDISLRSGVWFLDYALDAAAPSPL